MSDKWADFYYAIDYAEYLIKKEIDRTNFNVITNNSLDSVIVELKFLYTFLAYSHMWNDASSSSSSRNAISDFQFSKVAKAAEEFKAYLLNSFQTKPSSELIHVFTTLNQNIALLKPQIWAAYKGRPLFTQQRCPQLPLSKTSSSSWDLFCQSLESNLQYLSEGNYLNLDDHLTMQMRASEWSLNSLGWLLSNNLYYSWSPWKEKMVAHFGGMVVQVADVCCFCWYAHVDQSMQQEMAILLSGLNCKMDPDSAGFLDIGLGFLENGKDLEKSISSFLYYMLGLIETEVLQKEFVILLNCLIKIQEMHQNMMDDAHSVLVDIRNVIMEARYLKDKSWSKHKVDFAILFAKIWSLKAEISIRSNGNVLTVRMDDPVKPLLEGYRFLEQIFSPADEKSAEYRMLKLIEGVPKQVRSLYQSSSAKDYLVRLKASNLFLKCLVQIKLSKARALLLELLETDARLLLPLKLKIGTFQQGLFFLLEVVINEMRENTEDEKLILKDIELVTTRVISVCKTFQDKEVTEEGVKKMDTWLLELLEKVHPLKVKLRGLYLKNPRFNLPKIPGLSFIEFLLHTLRDLLNRKHDSLVYAAHQIESICSDLDFIVSTFQDVLEEGSGKQEYQHLHVRLVDVAYQAEYVIATMLGETMAVWQQSLWLYHLSEEISHIKKQLKDLDGNKNCNHAVHIVSIQRLTPLVSQFNTISDEEIMVGFSDQKEEIIDRLTRGTLQRDVVSLVGMPGIGKTTLANNVYCCPNVMYHFNIRAWCCVSQKYKRRDLLLDILSGIITVTDNTHAMTDADLDELLYKQLKGKRYLIVMDDMWSTEAWIDLQLSFPDDSNGSRILLTSRLQDVVSKITTSHPHFLPPLSDEESWQLLKLKIFHKQECPQELLEVGEQIARNCRGLPLAICAIAGLLHRTCGMSQELWKQAAESVISWIVNDPETQCRRILEMSYDHLPNHLKACLLYFVAFPEDKDIPIWRLQFLWVAEGFVRKVESKNVEELAEEYLMDLVECSLVMVVKRRSNGKVKTCRVHDVVRDLCLLKARDDRFLKVISTNDEPYSSFDALEYGHLYERFNSSNSMAYEHYRCYFSLDREQFVLSRPSGPFVRSLIFSAAPDMSPRCSYDVSFISDNFKLLRVLDLEPINMGSSFMNGIESLVELRYLAVCGDISSIPPSLSNLQNLETLIVKALKRRVDLPSTIWRMKKLRHILISYHAIFTLSNDEIGMSFQLDNLVTLSLPYFSLGEEMNEIIKKFPNLRYLKCVLSELKDVSVWVPALESLSQLESLQISYYGKAPNSGELKLPSSLKRLTLSNFHLSGHHISVIGRLQNLETLKLSSCAFEEEHWHMREGEFLKLRYLELDNSNIVHWDACSDHLFQLEQLLLRNCKHLKEVPCDFGSISTLQKIEVQLCGINVNESVRKIEAAGIEGLKIVINNSHSA